MITPTRMQADAGVKKPFSTHTRHKSCPVKVVLCITILAASSIGVICCHQNHKATPSMLSSPNSQGQASSIYTTSTSATKHSQVESAKTEWQDKAMAVPASRLQFIKEAIVRHKIIAVVSVAIVMLMIAGAVTFGVLYKQGLAKEQKALAIKGQQKMIEVELEEDDADADEANNTGSLKESTKQKAEEQEPLMTFMWVLVAIGAISLSALVVLKSHNYVTTDLGLKERQSLAKLQVSCGD